MSASFAVEPLDRFWPEADGLMAAHTREVDACDPADYRFDVAQAKAIENAGMLVICTARDGGRIIGYCIWFLSTSLVCAGRKIATQTGWYVTPDSREGGLGLRLFQFAINELRLRGVVEAFPHFWAKSSPRLHQFFDRLGAEPVESVYRMRLA